MSSRIWSEEMVRVTTNALDNAKRFQKDVKDPDVRFCLEELVFIVEVFVNQEVRRAEQA